jgi:hypothetical protein
LACLVCLVLRSDAGEAVDALAAEAVAGAFVCEDVGVVDEQDAANLIFQLVSSRYEHASLVLTSNQLALGNRSLSPFRRRWGTGPSRMCHTSRLVRPNSMTLTKSYG